MALGRRELQPLFRKQLCRDDVKKEALFPFVFWKVSDRISSTIKYEVLI
jgi:hypothetical protein